MQISPEIGLALGVLVILGMFIVPFLFEEVRVGFGFTKTTPETHLLTGQDRVGANAPRRTLLVLQIVVVVLSVSVAVLTAILLQIFDKSATPSVSAVAYWAVQGFGFAVPALGAGLLGLLWKGNRALGFTVLMCVVLALQISGVVSKW